MIDVKLLLISDTHGNQNLLEELMAIAKGVDVIIHLGDDYCDPESFLFLKTPLFRVPGTWGPEYQNPLIENRRFESFLNWRFFLSHTPTTDLHDRPEDIDPQIVLDKQQCDVFCHGHTHQPKIEQNDRVVILNPGHLKSEFDRGFPATYSLLTLSYEWMDIKIINLYSNKIFDQKKIFK